RRRSQPLALATPWKTRAELSISPDISSPVTFGFWHPVVLLPARFPHLASPTQEAILCHELLHVERRDWIFAVGEELVRAVFWFMNGARMSRGRLADALAMGLGILVTACWLVSNAFPLAAAPRVVSDPAATAPLPNPNPTPQTPAPAPASIWAASRPAAYQG